MQSNHVPFFRVPVANFLSLEHKLISSLFPILLHKSKKKKKSLLRLGNHVAKSLSDRDKSAPLYGGRGGLLFPHGRQSNGRAGGKEGGGREEASLSSKATIIIYSLFWGTKIFLPFHFREASAENEEQRREANLFGGSWGKFKRSRYRRLRRAIELEVSRL